jgi:hypothetical protein
MTLRDFCGKNFPEGSLEPLWLIQEGLPEEGKFVDPENAWPIGRACEKCIDARR